MKDQYDAFIGCKVSPQEKQKLELLAQQTHRHISQVIRLLISQAELADEPDIRLGNSPPAEDQQIPLQATGG
jgi:hypothetical protein